MKKITFQDLHPDLRIKIDSPEKEEFWSRIEDTGINQISEAKDYPPSRIYNWRSKDLSVPVEFAQDFLKNEIDTVRVKSGGRSRAIRIDLPLEVPEELITRIDNSVNVNKEGVPVYYSDEISLVERFRTLLEEYFGISGELYSRSGFELRFPRTVYLLLKDEDYNPDKAALIDQKGRIEDDIIDLGDREILLEDFEGRLYSRKKRLKLALEREDSSEIESIINEEVERSEKISIYQA